ncbi:acetyltransferase [Nitrospira sp. Nam74]
MNTTKRLFIVGAGGLGRELVDIVRASPTCRYADIAFIDDTVQAGTLIDGVPVIGDRRVLGHLSPDSVMVCVAVGNPEIRRNLIEDLRRYGHTAANLIDPTALIRTSATFEEGTLVLARAVISSHAFLGPHVVINIGAVIGHDVSVGRYSVIGAGALISGGATIGEGVLVGAGATILPHATVGSWSKVAMGAAVFSPVGANTTVLGNPARPIVGGHPPPVQTNPSTNGFSGIAPSVLKKVDG